MKQLIIAAMLLIPVFTTNIVNESEIELEKISLEKLNIISMEDYHYKNEMKKFVSEIHDHAEQRDKDFIIVQQNAEDLIFNRLGKIDKAYLKHIDGIGREDIFYGYEGPNIKTDESISKSISEKLDLFKAEGKKVLTIDYCSDSEKVLDTYKSSREKGYTGLVSELTLSNIMEIPQEYNNFTDNNINSLSQVENFLYLINPENYGTTEELVNDLSKTNHDLIVVDLFLYDEIMLDKEDLEKLKVKENGGERLVLCYLSIGEAEDYRYYYEKYNINSNTPFVLEENEMWEGNYKVKYWEETWKEIIYSGEDSYLNRILNSNFDGVYLDLVDAYQYFE